MMFLGVLWNVFSVLVTFDIELKENSGIFFDSILEAISHFLEN